MEEFVAPLWEKQALPWCSWDPPCAGLHSACISPPSRSSCVSGWAALAAPQTRGSLRELLKVQSPEPPLPGARRSPPAGQRGCRALPAAGPGRDGRGARRGEPWPRNQAGKTRLRCQLWLRGNLPPRPRLPPDERPRRRPWLLGGLRGTFPAAHTVWKPGLFQAGDAEPGIRGWKHGGGERYQRSPPGQAVASTVFLRVLPT